MGRKSKASTGSTTASVAHGLGSVVNSSLLQVSAIENSAESAESGFASSADGTPTFTTTNNVFDNCCFVLLCSVHNRILLSRGGIAYLPFVPLVSVKTWYDSSIDGALGILYGEKSNKAYSSKKKLPFKKFFCQQIFRFQLPQTGRFITRLTYLAILDPNNSSCCTKPAAENFKWYPIKMAMQNKVPNIWGPEVSYYAHCCSAKDYRGQDNNTISEYSLNDAYRYFPHESPTMPEEQMLSRASVTSNDIERLYADFIEHCFPSFFFTRDSFRVYMQKHEIESRRKRIIRFYAAFRSKDKPYMHFHELLLGLAAIDARTPHCSYRMEFVFRYYDCDKDGCLNCDEFKRLMRDITSEKPSTKAALKEMRKIGTTMVNRVEVVTLKKFKIAVGNHQFRGTSQLCRVDVSPFAQITRSLATRKLQATVQQSNLKSVILNSRYDGCCEGCKEVQYSIAPTCVVLDHTGKVSDYVSLDKSIKTKELNFSHDSFLMYLMNQINEFNAVKGNNQKFKGLFSELMNQMKEEFMIELMALCNAVSTQLEKEPRVLQVFGPTFVIGDIHGNLEDLLTLQTCLWKRVPLLTNNYLFLGDYVDRGKWGFECFLYLMVMKQIMPDRVFLLRGNHEIRSIQIKYSFQKELIKKYGQTNGQKIFDLYNNVFDRLPICAVVNNAIYCAHGGLPFTTQSLDTLSEVLPAVISNPELDALPAWEIMWSDPLEYNKFPESAQLIGVPVNAFGGHFLPNIKRGTSVVYNEYATMNFLKTNNLQYVIRAHEVPAQGYKLNFGTLCTTVFSCSHYCGADNECASVFIDNEGRIRIIRIDTTNNQSATGTGA